MSRTSWGRTVTTWENNDLMLYLYTHNKRRSVFSIYCPAMSSIWCHIFVCVHVCEWQEDQLEPPPPFSFRFSHTFRTPTLSFPEEENEKQLHIILQSFISWWPLSLSPLHWLPSETHNPPPSFPSSSGFIPSVWAWGSIFKSSRVIGTWFNHATNPQCERWKLS